LIRVSVEHGGIFDLLHLVFDAFCFVEVLRLDRLSFLRVQVLQLRFHRLELVALNLQMLRQLKVLILNRKLLVHL
jgi:hypothetical protein